MGLIAPTPVVPPLPSLTCAGGQEGGGGKGSTGSSTAPWPEQSLRRGPLRPRAGARQVAHGDRHGMGGLTATLGAWPSQDPNPGSERLRDALGTGASTSYTSHTGNSGCQQETLLEHWARAGSSCPKCSVPERTLACRLSHLPSQTTPGTAGPGHSPCVSPRKLVAERTRNRPCPKPMCGPSPAVHGAQESLLPPS